MQKPVNPQILTKHVLFISPLDLDTQFSATYLAGICQAYSQVWKFPLKEVNAHLNF